MTWVDLAVLGVLAVSALLAFLRGFVREVLGIGAWIGAALAAVWGVPFVREPLHRWVGPAWVDPVGFIGIFLGDAGRAAAGRPPDRPPGARLAARRGRSHAGPAIRPGAGCGAGHPCLYRGGDGGAARPLAGPGVAGACAVACLCRGAVGGAPAPGSNTARASMRLHSAGRPAPRPCCAPRRKAGRSENQPAHDRERPTRHDRHRPAPTTTSCTRNAGSSACGTCPTHPPSPPWVCTPCSTAARNRPASSASTAPASTRTEAWDWSATISATRA